MHVSRRRSTLATGAVSEATFLLRCMEMGWDICSPAIQVKHYDFVIRRPGQPWETVQVKTAYQEAGWSGTQRLAVSVRKRVGGKGKRYSNGDFDLLCPVDLQTNRIWLIPFWCVSELASNLSMRGCDPFLLKNGFSLTDATDKHRAMLKAKRTHPNARTTFEDAELIRRAHADGESRKSICARFKMGQTNVSRILRGESWTESP